MKLDLKNQSSAHEKQRSTIKSNGIINAYNAKAISYFYHFYLLFSKEDNLYLTICKIQIKECYTF